MINDTIDILDAKVVDFGIQFSVIANQEFNKYDVLENCLVALRRKFTQPLFIGEPFFITDIYNELNKLDSVADVVSVKMVRKTGVNYSNATVNIDDLISSDGRYVNVPKNVCFQIRFPKNDIKGSVK